MNSSMFEIFYIRLITTPKSYYNIYRIDQITKYQDALCVILIDIWENFVA